MAYSISDACVSCGACESECPTSCISAGSPYTINESDCVSCGACSAVCPVDAPHDN